MEHQFSRGLERNLNSIRVNLVYQQAICHTKNLIFLSSVIFLLTRKTHNQ